MLAPNRHYLNTWVRHDEGGADHVTRLFACVTNEMASLIQPGLPPPVPARGIRLRVRRELFTAGADLTAFDVVSRSPVEISNADAPILMTLPAFEHLACVIIE